MTYIPLELPQLLITRIRPIDSKLLITAESRSSYGSCPDCQAVSTSRHSQYIRVVRDLPISTWSTELHIKTRRFRCRNENCQRKTFAEQFQRLVAKWGRRTKRLAKDHGSFIPPVVRNMTINPSHVRSSIQMSLVESARTLPYLQLGCVCVHSRVLSIVYHLQMYVFMLSG